MESNQNDLTAYGKVVAVLTGDLVASQKHDTAEIEAAMGRISATARTLSKMVNADTRFTRFRGDGWQIVLGRAGLALRAALMIIADLKAENHQIETRISVGVGRWDNLGTGNLSDASGQAFFVSGSHLDDMPKHRRLAIAGGRDKAVHGVADRDWQAAIFDMAEWIANRLTQPQAEAMAMALRDDWQTQDELAQRLGITRQAMQARLTGAGFQAMENAIHVLQKYQWDPAA